jgi:hypothetical protein
MCKEKTSLSDYHLSAALKQNVGGHKFKDDCEVETFLAQ